jgi:hypothetical protein
VMQPLVVVAGELEHANRLARVVKLRRR